MPIVQLTAFQGKEALLGNPQAFKGVVKELANAKGFISAYHGFEVEDKRVHHIACLWQSLEDHRGFQSSSEYKTFKSHLEGVRGGPDQTELVQFVGDAEKTFGCPTTEVVIGKPKQGTETEELLSATKNVFRALQGAPGYYPNPTYGEVLEKPGNYYICLGWDSPEDHKNAVTGGGQGVGAVANFTQVVEHRIVHVHFNKCEA